MIKDYCELIGKKIYKINIINTFLKEIVFEDGTKIKLKGYMEYKTNRIKQYIPNYMDMSPEIVDFSSVEKLLEIDFVKRFKDFKEFNNIPFYRYSLSKSDDQYLLMAEYKNEISHECHIVGYLSNDIKLPEIKDI